jgi:PAS domain S-box-containing protein
LRVLLAHLPAAVAYLSGPQLTFAFANDAYLELVGGRPVVGRSVGEALPEIVGQGYLEKLESVLATGEPVVAREAEVRLVRGTGTDVVYVDFVYQPVRHGAEVVGVLVHASDVSEHVRARRDLETTARELNNAEDRYRTLFGTLPYGVIYHDAEHRVIEMNPAAERILGVGPEAVLGRDAQAIDWQARYEDGQPVAADDVPSAVALRTGRTVTDVVLSVPHRASGERRWLAVTAVPDSFDEGGRPQRAYVMFADVTAERRAAASLAERDSFLGRLRDANVLGVVLGDEQQVLDANDAFLDMLGYTRQDLAGGRMDWRAMTPPEWLSYDEDAVAQMRATGSCRPFAKEMVHADGRRVPVLLGAAVVDRDPLRWVTFTVDLSERQRAERERAELSERERAATAAAVAADEQLDLLMRTGALLSATRDRDELLQHAARLVLPALGDWAVVLTAAERGALQVVAAVHSDDAHSAPMGRLRDMRVSPQRPVSVQLAHRVGRARLVADLEAELALWRDEPMGEVLAELSPGALLAAPLTSAERRLGVLLIGRDRDRPPFDNRAVATLNELAGRLGLALRNAELSAYEHSVAETLQRAVLPDRLPDLPHLSLAVRYLPASEGLDVGGDWYDAFRLHGSLVGLVVGDVVGHNVGSASLMGQLRNILRAYALCATDPVRALADTNSALRRLVPDALATVCYGVLDTDTGQFTYASAGHPPPLVITEHGQPRWLDESNGLMLGVADDLDISMSSLMLRPGDSLLLYTDGLVEDHLRDLSEGMRILTDTLAGLDNPEPDRLCDMLLERMLGARTRPDDVCLLAATLTAQPATD